MASRYRPAFPVVKVQAFAARDDTRGKIAQVLRTGKGKPEVVKELSEDFIAELHYVAGAGCTTPNFQNRNSGSVGAQRPHIVAVDKIPEAGLSAIDNKAGTTKTRAGQRTHGEKSVIERAQAGRCDEDDGKPKANP